MQIHLIGGEKGGVGKSVIARLLAQYLIDKNHAFRIFDADLSHGAMMRYYTSYSELVDIRRFDNIDQIVEKALESNETIILDLAAQTSRPLKQWVDETGLLALSEEIGLKLNFWHVMDDGADSLKLLNDLINDYEDKTNYIVVKNYGRGNDFSHLQESGIAERLNNLNAEMLDIPGLHPPAMRKIDHFNASFWAAVNNSDPNMGPTLGLLERQRVKVWLNKSYEQFDRLNLG